MECHPDRQQNHSRQATAESMGGSYFWGVEFVGMDSGGTQGYVENIKGYVRALKGWLAKPGSKMSTVTPMIGRLTSLEHGAFPKNP